MVFLSLANLANRTHNKLLKRHKILRLSGDFYGRNRNCYKLAVRGVHKAFLFATQARNLDSNYVHDLRLSRLSGACAEHGIAYHTLLDNLTKCDIQLNAAVLNDLAIWEPRTFKCLTDIAKMKHKSEAPEYISEFVGTPDNVINKDSL